MEQRLKILGYISVGLGVLSALLCIIPLGIFFAILSGFFGLIFSSIYIFIDTRNQINTKKFTAGVLGMILSSIPVVLMLIVIILAKINR